MPLSRRYCYRHGCPGSGESPATVAYRPPSLWWGPVRVYGRRRWLSSSRQDTGAAGRSTTQLPARPDDINSGSPGEGRRHPISHLGPRQGIRETSLRVPQSDLQQSHGPRAPVGWVRLGGDSRVRYESGTGGYTARNRGRVARIERCWLAPRSTRTRNDPALEAEPQLPDLPRRKGRAYCLKRKREGRGQADVANVREVSESDRRSGGKGPFDCCHQRLSGRHRQRRRHCCQHRHRPDRLVGDDEPHGRRPERRPHPQAPLA